MEEVGGSSQEDLGAVLALTQPSTKPTTQPVLITFTIVVTPGAPTPHCWPTLPCVTFGQPDCETWWAGDPHSNTGNHWAKSHIPSLGPSSLCKK